jgi:methionyl aminopeptidase
MRFLDNLLPKVVQPKPKAPTIKKSRRGIHIKSASEIEIMRQAARIVATVLKEISETVQPGMTTADLDEYAEQRIREMGATPSFKGYYGFPGSICSCINNEVVHGIPSRRKIIKAGDVLKVDTGAYYNSFHGDSCITIAVGNVRPDAKKLIQAAEETLYKGIEQVKGFHGDSCITIAVGNVRPDAKKLIQAAEETLYKGIEQVKAGAYLLDVAGAIQDSAEAQGFKVVEEFTGHGVGQNLHEEPSVFNTRTQDLPNVKLKAGMTLAIEPILNAGSRYTRTLSDRWTVVTVDNSLSAQFEHTVLVTETGYEILTDRSKV